MFDTKNKDQVNITLIMKNDPFDDDGFDSGTYKIDYKNSSYRMENSYFIIETIKDGECIGQLIEMRKIKSYKIWQ